MKTVIFYASLFYFFLYMNNFKKGPIINVSISVSLVLQCFNKYRTSIRGHRRQRLNMEQRGWWLVGKQLLFRDQWILVFVWFCFHKRTLSSFSACSHSHSANDFLNGNSKALFHERSRANGGPVGRSQLQGKQTTFCRAPWKP